LFVESGGQRARRRAAAPPIFSGVLSPQVDVVVVLLGVRAAGCVLLCFDVVYAQLTKQAHARKKKQLFVILSSF
jgi:hypothetical protein